QGCQQGGRSMRNGALLVALGVLLAAGCEPARRFGGKAVTASKTEEPTKPTPTPLHHIWLAPEAPKKDIPIVYVHAGTNPKEWDQLREFWNHFPPMAAGQRTAHLGLSPFGAAAAIVLTDQWDVIKIKVPLGLPDPTPHVPAANPLGYAKWRLGQKLF